MEKFMSMLVVVVAAVMWQCATAQTVHVVGGNIGWTIPRNGAEGYTTWAFNKTFMVGDILIFNFATNAHDVVQVPKASFDTCSDDNKIGNPITTGPANVTLTSAGDCYYICSFGTHCQSGQKLATIVSATPGATAPPTPTTPSTPTTPATPPPTSSTAPEACPPEAPTPKADGPTTPSTPTTPPATPPPTSSTTPEACPPEAPTPKADGPTPPTTTSTRPEVLPPSPDSASSAVFAGFSLTVLGFAVGLFL
ncbi:cucumber peeling cupredoxin-like [Actinidia eriantha]|uniref:cucumber peeling cupredoxin-like n=1 Tax=Actinidia eriantha TaxID=165200 RepID=UPI00259039C9|nr:cucumber peeling cupredoxin-like [Actinidia eriantha]